MAHPDSHQTRNRSLNYPYEGSTPGWSRNVHYESSDGQTRQRIVDPEENFSNESLSDREVSESDDKKTRNEKTEETSKPALFGILILLVFLAILLMYLKIFSGGSGPESCKFHGLSEEALRSHFLNQPKDLSYIVSSILENERNSVDSLVLLHSYESDSTARCFAHKLTEIYAYEKRKECSITTIQPTDVNTSDDDFGEILKKYAGRKNGTAAVVLNLLGITSNKAQIFHTLCDDTIPTNIPSLFVFTLLSNSDPSNFPHREARNILSSAWKDLPDNVLDPLLARILGHVVQVSPEKKLPC